MPNTRVSSPVRASAQVCCLELLVGIRQGEPRYTVVVSLDGREGTIAHSWGRFGQFIDEHELTDMMVWLQKCVADAIVLRSGAQQVLRM